MHAQSTRGNKHLRVRLLESAAVHSDDEGSGGANDEVGGVKVLVVGLGDQPFGEVEGEC